MGLDLLMFVVVESCGLLETSVNEIILSLTAKMLGGRASAASESSGLCMCKSSVSKNPLKSMKTKQQDLT